MLHINSAAYTRIAFLNQWVFDVIFSSTQLSQDFKVSNGGPANNKIPVKIASQHDIKIVKFCFEDVTVIFQ